MSRRVLATTIIYLATVVYPVAVPAVTFESWDQAVASGNTASQQPQAARTSGEARQPEKSSPGTAGDRVTGQVTGSAPAKGQSMALIRFGAGATYLVFVRPSDFATGQKVMSEFSVSLNPWRSVVEIGADLALAKDNCFFIRPNLKLILGSADLAFFLEGFLALYSHAGGMEVGGGGGLGAVTGIIDNLALEVFASVMIFDMSNQAAGSLVHGGFLGDSDEPGGKLFVPYAGARLVARF